MLARLSSTAARATARHRRQLAAPIACGSLLVPSSKQRREINTLLAAASTAEVAASVPLVAAPLVGPAAVTFLSVSPALGAQILFLSPMQAMKQFREDGTTGGERFPQKAPCCVQKWSILQHWHLMCGLA